MARTLTTSIPLQFKAPEFSLPNVVSGNLETLSELRGSNGTVVMFICNHCPFVVHVIDELVRVANDYQSKGIQFIAISSNDAINYPADAPDKMKELAVELDFPFPYLYDETQEVAKAYTAACTPDFNVFDKELNCIYRGQLDDSRPGNNEPVNGKDLRKTLDYLSTGKTIDFEQKPSLGCNIKWK